MVSEHSTSRISRRGQLGRTTPRSFSPSSRWYFERDRRASYLSRCGGTLTERQALLVDQLVAAEWGALLAERSAGAMVGPAERLAAMKLAAEHRRQILLFDRALAAATPPPAPPPAPSADDILAALQRRLA